LVVGSNPAAATIFNDSLHLSSHGKILGEQITERSAMSPNAKKALISLMGGAGFIVFLIGIFTDAYNFWVGVIAAFVIWIVTGAASTWLGVKK
jgi:hypothetical protein